MIRLCFVLACLLATSVNANGISPYLPLNLSVEVERQIEKVFALTPGAPLTRPYRARDLLMRLPHIKDSHPVLYSRLSQYLDRYMQPTGLTHAAATVSVSNDNKTPLPNQRNIRMDSDFAVSLGAIAYVNPYIYVSSGVTYEDAQGPVHHNTHLAAGYEYLQVDLGYREHWFSPFQDSAMLVSTHAEASPSITLSNAKPISRWNFRYEIFYSMLESVDEIVLGDQTFPGKPKHAGLHLSFTPLDFWTIGLNRTLQFGGGQREVSFGDFWEALLDPAGKDNVGDVDTDDINFEFGNQQASVTTRFNLHWGIPFSLYAEYAGEDTVDESNFKLGNDALSLGVYFPALTDTLSMRYEFSDISDGWYVHHLYRDGYTNNGQVMGHWAGAARVFNRDTNVKAHSVNLNWQTPVGHLLDVTLRLVDNQNTPTEEYERGYQFDATYSIASQYGFWGARLVSGKDVFGDTYTRLSAFLRW